jgi:oligopeptide/dipeptide ABC transporter ATP-binding protein
LYSGRIFEQLDATRLTSEPDNPYTRRLLGSILTVGSRRELSQGRLLTRPSSGSGCVFAPRCDSAQGRCDEQAPGLIEIGDEGEGWLSRCHFAGDDKPSAEPLASAADAGEGQQL